jgi:superfamily I DNA and RNA helicase
MVQMFENIHMWNALGYKVLDGCLDYGNHVVMGRHPIERLDDKQLDDQIVFKSFESLEEQDAWVVQEIKRNLTEDGTQARDIMVVVPAMQLAYTGSAEMRGMLSNEKIPFHVVGEDDSDDKFWNGESVAICGILKARSNEAPMVYVVEAHNAFYTRYDTAMNRNFLYAAITRSRAWVRVVGFGQEMDSLVEEFERIKRKGFKFDFVYPTRKELSKLRLVYREAGQELGAELLEPEKVIGEAVELIRQGKIELDEEQKGVLRDWLDREAKL